MDKKGNIVIAIIVGFVLLGLIIVGGFYLINSSDESGREVTTDNLGQQGSSNQALAGSDKSNGLVDCGIIPERDRAPTEAETVADNEANECMNNNIIDCTPSEIKLDWGEPGHSIVSVEGNEGDSCIIEIGIVDGESAKGKYTSIKQCQFDEELLIVLDSNLLLWSTGWQETDYINAVSGTTLVEEYPNSEGQRVEVNCKWL